MNWDSSALKEVIRGAIAADGGISFARFMELALYCTDLGYYERSPRPIGREGDFYTSVSAGRLFGELLAYQFGEWIDRLNSPGPGQTGDHSVPETSWPRVRMGRVSDAVGRVPADLTARERGVVSMRPFQIVEAGAHDGRLALDILGWLRERRAELFETLEYWIVEPSHRRQEWQQRTLQEFAEHTRWFSSWEAVRPARVRGVIFSNELLDSFPIHRVSWDASDQSWFEWGVDWKDGGFVWIKMPGSETLKSAASTTFTWPQLPPELLAVLPDGFTTEVSPAALAWWKQAAEALDRGRLLTLDYGLEAEGFFSPDRSQGTLRGYYRHHLTTDLLAHVGEQDMTAHVNFSELRDAGERAGLRTDLFEPQVKFVTDIAERTWRSDSGFGPWTAVEMRQFQTLTHPEHLGRAFRALVQSR